MVERRSISECERCGARLWAPESEEPACPECSRADFLRPESALEMRVRDLERQGLLVYYYGYSRGWRTGDAVDCREFARWEFEGNARVMAGDRAYVRYGRGAWHPMPIVP